MSREAMQMALETAEQIACADYRHWEDLASLSEFERWARSRANHIAEALRARLSQCERCGEVNPAEIHTCTPQEPVAWVWTVNSGAGYITRGVGFDKADIPFAKHTPLYFAPPQRQQRTYTPRKWQGLTDEEYEAMAEHYVTNCYFDTLKYARAIEAKLKEKNT